MTSTGHFGAQNGRQTLTSPENCTCVIDTTTVPELIARPVAAKASGVPTSFLFLLGYPHTGTSALHFLLATSGSVSTIADPALLASNKEGMAHLPGGRPADRWTRSFWSPEYAELVERIYLSHWNRSKILLENSPPEIYLHRQLNSSFSKYGKVRFILLVHGVCGMRPNRYAVQLSRWNMSARCFHGPCHEFSDEWKSYISASWALALHTYLGIIADYGQDVFVVRYEDLCLRLSHVLRDLAAWEPRLADINVSRVPKAGRNTSEHHVPSTISSYCESAVQHWREPTPAHCSAKQPAYSCPAERTSSNTQAFQHQPVFSSTCASMAAQLGYFYRPGQFDCSFTSY